MIRYIFIWHLVILSLFALGHGKVISSKIIEGVEVSLVKTKAEVLPNKIRENNSEECRDDGTKSLFFIKLNGTTGLSKQKFKVIPNERNGYVNIYYIEKNNETNKHEYTVFFNKKDVLFTSSKNIKVLNKKITYTSDAIVEVGNVKHFVRDMFNNGVIYLFLFLFFLKLNGFFDNSTIDSLLNKKVNYSIQILLILMFLFGGEHIIRTENSNCYQTPYATVGKVDYFIDEPYVHFVDCYGHKSNSSRKNPELLGKAKGESVQIYYNHESREYYSNEDTNIYRVFTSEEDYADGHEVFIHVYFGFLMLFIFIYSYIAKEKKLHLSSLLAVNTAKVYRYKNGRNHFDKVLHIADKEYYTLGTVEEYFFDPIIYTNNRNQIVIERFKLFDILLPGAVALGLLWVFLNTFLGLDDMNTPTPTENEKMIIGIIGLIGILFLYITVKNIMAKKRVGLFDINSKKYSAYLEDKIISFDDIYAYTITYKTVWDTNREYTTVLYELDIVLNNGHVVNLYARKGTHTELYNEAKIIARYTDKPIYDFGNKDINQVFRIEKYLEKDFND